MRTLRWMLLLAVVAGLSPLFVDATRAVPAAPGSPGVCGVVVPSAGRTLSVGSPCLVAVPVGTSLPIVLATSYRWSGVHVDRPSLVSVANIARPASGGLRAMVRARAIGVVNVSATGAVNCPSGQMCPALARVWTLRVFITASSASSVLVPLASGDDGRQFRLRVGDVVTLQLIASGLYTWSMPRTSSPHVMAIVRSLGSASPQVTLRAMARGTSLLTSTGTPVCYPQCLMASRQFRVVLVVAG